MVKAKEFWSHLCDKLEYRFFSGVPVSGFKGLFKNMNADMMHYVPAINEQAAVSLSSGGWVSGIKSGVLMSANKLSKVSFGFNYDFNIPILILASSEDRPILNKKFYVVDVSDDYTKDLSALIKYIETKKRPGILFFREGDII